MMRTGLLILGSILWANTAAQTTHLIKGFEFYYDPDTLVMQVGDSVKFRPNGIHDMVETDSASWAINQAIGNGGFVTVISEDTTFVIDTAGTYYFVCSPHGFVGMRGVLLVNDLSTGMGVLPQDRSELSVYPIPANGQVTVAWEQELLGYLELIDTRGARLARIPVNGREVVFHKPVGSVSGPMRFLLRDREGTIIGTRPVIWE